MDFGRRCFSQAEIKGQVGLVHLLSVNCIKLFIHRHCEDVLPQTHTTCREDTQGEGGCLVFQMFKNDPMERGLWIDSG